ncbi:hypothetical protein M427DRAFT_132003 [Gonapodya prolifera JEL478]|uniref:Uncharacterized protein n=1 Tax=Gonapodya prolifera (strain JEL478) TaxID=1344416 RepID=A0A139ARV8_GONPJ|nr:hypothetical protein M427DRAFT_132003 [Gonapodya prolifera JEL478]|eukprot:KXS19481.1 hypothetical protein M427DRAFT_132003 [Gonapodya prolifera JEL478]
MDRFVPALETSTHMPPPPPYDSQGPSNADYKRSFASFRISVGRSSEPKARFLSRLKQSKIYTIVDNIGSEYRFEFTKDASAIECASSVQTQLLARRVLVANHHVQVMLEAEAERARVLQKQLADNMATTAAVTSRTGTVPSDAVDTWLIIFKILQYKFDWARQPPH